jgi:hypothetical protein
VSLEDEFWNAIKQIAITQEISLRDLVLEIDNERADGGLVYVRNYYSGKRGAKTQATYRPSDDARQDGRLREGLADIATLSSYS